MRKLISILGWVLLVVFDIFYTSALETYFRYSIHLVDEGKKIGVTIIFLLPLLIFNLPAFFILRKKIKLSGVKFNPNAQMYTRTETDTSIIFIYNSLNTYILYSLFVFLYLAYTVNLIISTLAIAVCVYSLMLWSNSSQDRQFISKYARNNGVTVRGSKFSFSNPLTVVIAKQD